MRKIYENVDYHSCDLCGVQDNFIDLNDNCPAICECGNKMDAVFSVLLISDANGIYIPQIFYNNFDFGQWKLNKNDYEELSNPDNECYWDMWEQLLNNAECCKDGLNYYLDQDGDLFARACVIYDND